MDMEPNSSLRKFGRVPCKMITGFPFGSSVDWNKGNVIKPEGEGAPESSPLRGPGKPKEAKTKKVSSRRREWVLGLLTPEDCGSIRKRRGWERGPCSVGRSICLWMGTKDDRCVSVCYSGTLDVFADLVIGTELSKKSVDWESWALGKFSLPVSKVGTKFKVLGNKRRCSASFGSCWQRPKIGNHLNWSLI